MPETRHRTNLIERISSTELPAVSWHSPDLFITVGVERRTIPSQYYWDGLKRGGDPLHPHLLFQYTLSGWGCYIDNGSVHKITEGTAFTALIPSEHAYYLPVESDHWTFFWIILSHPYIISRIDQTQKQIGTVLSLTPNDLLLARAANLVEGVSSQTFRDQWAAEQALFEFLMEYERSAHRSLYPEDTRELMLEDIRRYVLRELGRTVSVEELANRKGMSRSHFSHHFKAVTGMPPAQWVTQVCLDQATQLLLTTDRKLEAVAADTGFANANHLCKVFRRHFHMSPGKFRQQRG